MINHAYEGICMNAYMYECMCMSVGMYAFMHACMHACMYVCMYECIHPCMYVCMSTLEQEDGSSTQQLSSHEGGRCSSLPTSGISWKFFFENMTKAKML